MSTREKPPMSEYANLRETSVALHRNGEIILRIHVRPSTSRSCFKGQLADGTHKVDIAAPPEDGKANRELVKFLAKEFGVPKAKIEIISGLTSRRKTVRIHR